MWVDYWELTNRINEVQPPEFAAFAQRWSGTYVEDRLRNDWLLELVRRRDLATFAAEFPRFRMNDDREVTCFALAGDQLAGKDVRDAASRPGWRRRTPTTAAPSSPPRWSTRSSSRRPKSGRRCASIEAGKPRGARQAAALLSDSIAAAVAEVADSPLRFSSRRPARRRATMPS